MRAVLYLGKFTKSIDINSDPQKVWNVLSDYEKQPEWFDGCKEAKYTSASQRGVGTKIHGLYIVGPNTVEIDFDVTQFSEPERLAFKAESKNFKSASGSWALSKVDGRTRLNYDFDFELPASRLLFNRLITRILERSAEKTLANIKERVEKRT